MRGVKAAGLRLGTLGVLITVLITGLALLVLAPTLPSGLPPPAVWLAVSCLGATDSGALEDLLVSLRHSVSGRLSHLLGFEAALSTVVALLCFGFAAAILQAHGYGAHQSLHAALASRLPQQLGALTVHMLAGLVAGVAVGGGLVAVFLAGVCISNGRYRIDRFEQQALGRVMQPFNTAAELTVLLLLGLMVKPAVLVTVLPVGLALALVLQPAFPRKERLIVAGCGLRAAVPLALAVSLTEELPHLQGITAAAVEPLAEQLLALIFAVVLIDLVLQPQAMRQLVPAIAARGPTRQHGPTAAGP